MSTQEIQTAGDQVFTDFAKLIEVCQGTQAPENDDIRLTKEWKHHSYLLSQHSIEFARLIRSDHEAMANFLRYIVQDWLKAFFSAQEDFGSDRLKAMVDGLINVFVMTCYGFYSENLTDNQPFH